MVDSPVRGSHASGLADGIMMRRCWRAVVALALARADEVRFAAKVSSWWHSDVAPTFETLEAVARQSSRRPELPWELGPLDLVFGEAALAADLITV